jgi:two-component system, OmpR family, sensor histidine kinase VicK
MSADSQHNLPENIFQTIFEKSPGSLLVKADIPRFTILAASDSYLEVTDTTRDAILGRGFSEVFPDSGNIDEHIRAHNIFTRVIKTGKKVDVPRYRYDIFNADTQCHEEHYWSCSNMPVRDDKNKIAYILNTVVDITGEVKAKEAALESENRLSIAVEITGLATWELNLRSHSFKYSPRMAEIFGHSADAVLSLSEIRSQISKEDAENIIRPSFQLALVTGEYQYEVKVLWPDGSLHWIKTQGAVVFDENKKPLSMLGTILDITETKRDEIRKNDFIAMASHELKTPLTSLKSYIQLLARKLVNNDDEFISNALQKAGNQVNKMSDLIYGFLDLSRLESGKLQIKIQHFDINKLIEESIAETLLHSYSNTIIFNTDEVIMVYADREKIGQVINNFLSNATKYSPKDSEITIVCTITKHNVQVSVTDMGIGIKHKDQEKLFQRFYRVENDDIKNVSGFGIGLYLSSEIIQRHKGKIWVESEADKGSTFSFSLPMTISK